MRGVEMHERLATRERDRFTPAELIMIASDAGYHSLGWSEGGRIAEEHWRTSSWFVRIRCAPRAPVLIRSPMP